MTDARTIRDTEALAKKSFCVLHPDVPLRIEMAQGKPNVWCRKCQGRPASTQTRQSLTSKYKQGMPIAAAIEPHMRRKHGGRDGMSNDTALALIDPSASDIATVGQAWGTVLEGFGAIKNVQLEMYKAAQFAAAGFKPMHFYIIHGKLFMNADGWTFHVRRELGDRFAGIGLEDLPSDEPGKVVKRATLKEFNAQGKEFESGRATAWAGGSKEKNPVAKDDPEVIAEKRARVRAIRATVPLGVDIGAAIDPNDIVDEPAPIMDQIAERAGEIVEDARDARYSPPIDTETGEIAREVNVDGPDDQPITEPLTKEHPAIVKVKEYLEGLDYSGDQEYPWLEYEGKDGIVVGLHALVAMLQGGWSPEQIVHVIVTTDPARQEEETLPW